MFTKSKITKTIIAALCGTFIIAEMPTRSFAGDSIADKMLVLKTPVSVENEIDIDWEKLSRTVLALLIQKRYDELDSLAQQLRTSRQCYPNGRWKLDYFYSAFAKERSAFKEKVGEQDFQSRIAMVEGWQKARPQSVTAKIALANLYYSYGWLARGGGYADTVTDQGGKLFEQREETALRLVEEAQKSPVSCPRSYYLQVQIDRDLSKDNEMETAFLASTKKFPTYKTVYFAKVLCLQPRWGGDEGAWEAFAKQSADKLGGKAGDELYAQLIWAVEATHWYYKENLFRTFKVDYARVHRGFDYLMADNPGSFAVLSEYCFVASRAGDKPTASRMFRQLAGRVDREAWWNEYNFTQWRNWLVG